MVFIRFMRGDNMQKNTTIIGILFGLLCYQLFTLSEVCMKWLSTSYSPVQIIFFSGMVAVISFFSLAYSSGKLRDLKTYRFHKHIIRGSYGIISTASVVLALKYLSVPEFTVLAYTAPFVGLVLAFYYLREPIKINKIIAIIIGFAGVLFIKPIEGVQFNYGLFWVFVTVVSASMIMIKTRELSWTDTTASINFWNGVIALSVSAVLLPFCWRTPSLFDLALMVSIGILRTSANLFLTFALKHASVNAIMPLDYSGLLWAALFGYLIWGDMPTLALYQGAALIIAAGLYLSYREILDDKGIHTSMVAHIFNKLK